MPASREIEKRKKFKDISLNDQCYQIFLSFSRLLALGYIRRELLRLRAFKAQFSNKNKILKKFKSLFCVKYLYVGFARRNILLCKKSKPEVKVYADIPSIEH